MSNVETRTRSAVRLILPIWQDEQHKKWKMDSKVKVYVNNGQINRTADLVNNKFGPEK